MVLLNPTEGDQLKFAAPTAVHAAFVPKHILVELTDRLGCALTLIYTVSLSEHPSPLYPVTKYPAFNVGDAIGFGMFRLDKVELLSQI